MTLIPILHGGPVVPEKNRGFNPKKHVARPPEPNPWEICTQLHCGAGMIYKNSS